MCVVCENLQASSKRLLLISATLTTVLSPHKTRDRSRDSQHLSTTYRVRPKVCPGMGVWVSR